MVGREKLSSQIVTNSVSSGEVPGLFPTSPCDALVAVVLLLGLRALAGHAAWKAVEEEETQNTEYIFVKTQNTFRHNKSKVLRSLIPSYVLTVLCDTTSPSSIPGTG